MKIILCDRNTYVVDAWRSQTGLPALCGDLFAARTDAVVSPANSFGFMDGGVDWRITERLGPGVQSRLQRDIRSLFFGELLVGQAHPVFTGDPACPWVISAPTMRVPLKIDDANDIFLAARAAIRCAKMTGVSAITFPGMGTGCGEVHPDLSVRMMWAGIQAGLHGEPFPTSWREAQRTHFARLAPAGSAPGAQ